MFQIDNIEDLKICEVIMKAYGYSKTNYYEDLFSVKDKVVIISASRGIARVSFKFSCCWSKSGRHSKNKKS